MSMVPLQLQFMKQSLPLRVLILFGLEVIGLGRAAGCGQEAVGAARHIRALSGFHIVMLFATEDMYSFRGDGDNSLGIEAELYLGNAG